MKIFKISKTYMVPAADKASADAMIKAAGTGETYLVWQLVRELPELGGTQIHGWVAELRKQLSI